MEKKATVDILLTGATIFCGTEDEKGNQNYDFIAISGNKIAALGVKGEEANYTGSDTQVVALTKNQMVMPGLHDNHIHLIQAGMMDKYVDLTTATSEGEAAEMTAAFAATIPDEEWIIGFGWSRMGWKGQDLPTAASLDPLIKNRPVFLLDSELHGAWVNTNAMERCGVNAGTPDTPFGEIAKDSDGNPTGYLYETALCLVGREAFQFSQELIEELIYRYTKNAVKWGITSVSDMTPYLGLNLAYEETYYKLDRENKLHIRVNAARNLFEDMETFLSVMHKASASATGMYRVSYMKQFVDGVISNYTALLLKDYEDRPGHKGSPLLDLDQLKQAVMAAHKNNISVRLHACGEGAVRTALDAFEEAINTFGATKARHQIEHIEVIAPEDIARFAELGVIASVQPEHIISGIPSFYSNCYPQLLGSARNRYTWPFKTMTENGVTLACGSDAPVVEGDPFYGMYCAMTRIHPDGTPEGGWNPQEKLTREDILNAYTKNAALAELREDELGTIEPGKLADITVLDRNLLTSTPEEVKDTKVLYTIVDGKIVYQGI